VGTPFLKVKIRVLQHLLDLLAVLGGAAGLLGARGLAGKYMRLQCMQEMAFCKTKLILGSSR
jgi:hypothetical protein